MRKNCKMPPGKFCSRILIVHDQKIIKPAKKHCMLMYAVCFFYMKLFLCQNKSAGFSGQSSFKTHKLLT